MVRKNWSAGLADRGHHAWLHLPPFMMCSTLLRSMFLFGCNSNLPYIQIADSEISGYITYSRGGSDGRPSQVY